MTMQDLEREGVTWVSANDWIANQTKGMTRSRPKPRWWKMGFKKPDYVPESVLMFREIATLLNR